jgi:hypothetical protein
MPVWCQIAIAFVCGGVFGITLMAVLAVSREEGQTPPDEDPPPPVFR